MPSRDTIGQNTVGRWQRQILEQQALPSFLKSSNSFSWGIAQNGSNLIQKKYWKLSNCLSISDSLTSWCWFCRSNYWLPYWFSYCVNVVTVFKFVFVPNIDWNYRFIVMFKSLKASKWKPYFDNAVCKVRPSSDVAPFMRRTQCKLELKQWLFAHLHWVQIMERATSELGLSLNLFLISSFWNFFYTAYKLPPNITPPKTLTKLYKPRAYMASYCSVVLMCNYW